MYSDGIILYNSLTNKKESFIPIEDGKVKMYLCGPTVYNYIHIGNARPAVIFDSVRRFLEYKGYEVNYVSNFTDVDDKIINVANELGVECKEISEKFIDAYLTDLGDLGCKKATANPKVTDHIDDIINFISVLINKGFAYVSNGDVYFRSRSFDNYGKLSNQKIDNLLVGARIEKNDLKEDDVDFVLWKNAKPDEISWVSPWGNGRPGWHIECSVMAREHLGETIDIHAGGVDLKFPHHENEIAQSEAHNDKTFARYWLHNGHVMVDDKKMAKSSDNFLLVKDIKSIYDTRVLRLFLLSVHYRSPINYSVNLLDEINVGFKRILNSINNLNFGLNYSVYYLNDDSYWLNEISSLLVDFDLSMSDDFNTAKAVSLLFDLSNMINIYLTKESVSVVVLDDFFKALNVFSDILGLDLSIENVLPVEYSNLLTEREEARKARNYNRSDEIRDYLLSVGVVLEDTRYGVRWYYK